MHPVHNHIDRLSWTMLPLVGSSTRLLVRRSTSSLVIRQGSRGTRLDTSSCRRWLGTSSSPTSEQDLSGFELRQYGKDDPPRLTCKTCSHILYDNPKVSTQRWKAGRPCLENYPFRTQAKTGYNLGKTQN